jgi:hypothetical protein
MITPNLHPYEDPYKAELRLDAFGAVIAGDLAAEVEDSDDTLKLVTTVEDYAKEEIDSRYRTIELILGLAGVRTYTIIKTQLGSYKDGAYYNPPSRFTMEINKSNVLESFPYD